MQILVASSNIFRRELSTFVLSEAGYDVGEVVDRASLFLLLSAASPRLLVIDASLSGADPLAFLLQIRSLTDAPILWVSPQPFLPGEAIDRFAWVIWPYNTPDLLLQIARLLQPTAAAAMAATVYGHPSPA